MLISAAYRKSEVLHGLAREIVPFFAHADNYTGRFAPVAVPVAATVRNCRNAVPCPHDCALPALAVKSDSVKGDVIIRFNPTDGAFIQRLYNAFDTLDKKQDKYADEVQKCGDRVEIFNIADRRDKEMREIIDGLFEEPVCNSIFGNMNLYAMADGLHVWTNFLLALMDETDSAFAREQKATNPRIQKYTAKYRR